MRRYLIIPALLGIAVLGQSQVYGQGPWGRDDRYPRRDDPYYRNDPYDRNDSYYGRNGSYGGRYGHNSAAVDRAMSDLQRLRGGWFNHDRKHIDKALSELSKFQDKYYRRGKFDSGHLDKAIDNMKKIVDNGRGRDRDMIYNDIMMLRDFRASGGYSRGRGAYGYRY